MPLLSPSGCLVAALACLLPLAACDSADPATEADALVGTWTLVDARAETVVRSRADQALLLLNEPVTGQVTVTGDQTYTLTRARYSAEPSVGQILALEPEAQLPGAFQFTTLVLGRSTNDQGVSRSDATFTGIVADGSRTRTYRASLPSDIAPFVRDGGQLVVPTITMSDGDGRSVTASGALTFSTIQAPAGRDVAVPADGTRLPASGDLSITLSADSLATLAIDSPNEESREQGTWTFLPPNRISIPFGGQQQEFDVEIDGRQLVLTEVSEVAATCATATDCLATVEDEVFAERGSLASAQRTVTYRFRR